MSDAARTERKPADGKWVVALVGIPIAATLLWLVLGMPGMDHSTDEVGMGDVPGMATGPISGEVTGLERLAPAEFAERLSNPEATVVNVHAPHDGELTRTDLSIAFDRIVGDERMPTDRRVPILLYCRTGRMSRIAGEALIGAGYRDVVDLAGGMDAWEASGRPLMNDPQGA